MLVGVERLLEDVVTGEDHDDWQVLVNKSQHTVLQLTGHDSLTVEVGDFLDLESTLEGSGELAATTQEKQGLLIAESLLAKFLDGAVLLEDLLDLSRNIRETLHNLLTAGLLGCAVLAKRQRKHDHGDKLRGVGLGGGNTDLGSSVDVDTAVGEERDGGTDNVDDTHGQGTALQAVAEGHERISGLTRLGDEDASVVTEDGSLAIEEVRGKLDGDGDLGKLLEDTTDSHARVVTGSAGNEDDSAATANRCQVRTKTTKGDSLVGNVETTTHGVDNGLGLLEDLLLHEVIELALHDLLELELEGLDGADVRATIGLPQAVNVEGSLVNVSDIVVFEVHDLLGVLDDGRGVRREEELSRHGHAIVRHEGAGLRAVQQRLVRGAEQVVGRAKEVGSILLEGDILGSGLGRQSAVLIRVLHVDEVNLHAALGLDTNDKRRTLTGSNDLVRVVNGLDEKAVGTLKLQDDSLGQVGQADGRVLVVQVLGQLGNALGIGLGLESEALALEQSLELLVIGDDTIVNDAEFPCGIRPAKGGDVCQQRPALKKAKARTENLTCEGGSW